MSRTGRIVWGGLSIFAYLCYGAAYAMAYVTHDQGLLAATMFGSTAWTWVVATRFLR